MTRSARKSSRGYDRETFHQGISMKPHRVATALLLLAASAPALADIDRIQTLSQGEFRLLSEDLGAALSYKPLQPIAPLNLGGCAMYSSVPKTGVTLWGGALSWAAFPGNATLPAFGVRASYTKMFG